VITMYAARIKNLAHHESVTALCAACGHVAEVRVEDLWRRFPRYKRIAEIKLWCTHCGERERVELDATKALGNDRAPDRQPT
jgi:transcription elongation factor Elf1